MDKHVKSTKSQLIVGICFFAFIIILNGAMIIGTPYLFVRVVNLILVIVIAACLGAFIRELVIQSGSKGEQAEKSSDGS